MATTSDYHLTRAIGVRVVGALLVLLALLLVATTVVVAVLSLSVVVVVVVAALGVVAVLVAGHALTRWVPVVRLGEDGYRVRLVRDVGVTAARWTEVNEAVTTTTPRGLAVVELRLGDGRTTTLPVALLDVDREQFVRDLQGHLRRGQGLRPLG